jgi:hypothetical protein
MEYNASIRSVKEGDKIVKLKVLIFKPKNPTIDIKVGKCKVIV